MIHFMHLDWSRGPSSEAEFERCQQLSSDVVRFLKSPDNNYLGLDLTEDQTTVREIQGAVCHIALSLRELGRVDKVDSQIT
jgi:hypothetical protein